MSGKLRVVIEKGSESYGEASGLQYQQDDGQSFGKLSSDGKLAAECSVNLVIRQIPSKKVMHTFELEPSVDGDWSPDSRYFAYGSLRNSATSGVWILDATTGDNRLLAHIDATNPSWSHDGRFLAADESGKNKIVILDVSSIYLENGIDNAPEIAQ